MMYLLPTLCVTCLLSYFFISCQGAEDRKHARFLLLGLHGRWQDETSICLFNAFSAVHAAHAVQNRVAIRLRRLRFGFEAEHVRVQQPLSRKYCLCRYFIILCSIKIHQISAHLRFLEHDEGG